MEHTLMFKKKRKTSRCPERAAKLIEITADIGYGTIVIIRRRFYDNGDTVRTVSLEKDFFIIALIFRCRFFDCSFDIFFGHIGCLSILHEHTQTRIGIGIGATGFYGNRNFFSEFGKGTCHVAPTFEFAGFSIFKCSSHIGIFFLFYVNEFISMMRPTYSANLLRHDS